MNSCKGLIRDGAFEHLEMGLHIHISLCKLGKGVLHYWLGSAFWLSCAKPGSFMSNLLHGSLRIDLHREERLYIVEYWILLLLKTIRRKVDYCFRGGGLPLFYAVYFPKISRRFKPSRTCPLNLSPTKGALNPANCISSPKADFSRAILLESVWFFL